jgi:mRNA interferase HicA
MGVFPCRRKSLLLYKNGVLSPPVPYHGAKEMGEGLRKKIIKEMGLKQNPA